MPALQLYKLRVLNAASNVNPVVFCKKCKPKLLSIFWMCNQLINNMVGSLPALSAPGEQRRFLIWLDGTDRVNWSNEPIYWYQPSRISFLWYPLSEPAAAGQIFILTLFNEYPLCGNGWTSIGRAGYSDSSTCQIYPVRFTRSTNHARPKALPTPMPHPKRSGNLFVESLSI